MLAAYQDIKSFIRFKVNLRTVFLFVAILAIIMQEIINKVEQSGLITIELNQMLSNKPRIAFDLKDWLYEGLILREKDFREGLMAHDWSQYRDAYVCVHCSADAIVPIWAYMLVAGYLQGVAVEVFFSSIEEAENMITQREIAGLDTAEFVDQRVIVKGCSDLKAPEAAYMAITMKLQPVVKSLMFGEACSTVPVFKRK